MIRQPKPGVVDLVDSLRYTYYRHWKDFWSLGIAYIVLSVTNVSLFGALLLCIATFTLMHYVFMLPIFKNAYVVKLQAMEDSFPIVRPPKQ